MREFAGDPGDGENPYGDLTLDGTTLYGMTLTGGANDEGVIFKINTDGTGYTHLREFAGTPGDGGIPYGDLTLNGTTLYGMTYSGGANNEGVIFKMNTDGTGYTHLREFAGNPGDGENPSGSLTLDGTTLYGMTQYGGASDMGVVFSQSTVPEPSTIMLALMAGAAGVGLRRKRRKRR